MKKTAYITLALVAIIALFSFFSIPTVTCDFCDAEYKENLGYTRTFADDEDEKWYYCPDCYKEIKEWFAD